MIEQIISSAINPALHLLPPALDTRSARVMLVAIGLQESGLRERVQIVQGGGKGPARGLWQFERGGGVRGVLTHLQTAPLALRVCMARQVQPVTSVVWGELETDDVLAAAFARLLLYSDPQIMPTDSAGGWALYLRTWRPGKPKPDTWAEFYSQAQRAVT